MKKLICFVLILLVFSLLLTACVERDEPEETDEDYYDSLVESLWNEMNKEPESALVYEIYYTVYDDHAEVTGSNLPMGEVIILSEYNGKKVTRIADGAFEGVTSIKSLTLPETLTDIGANAFMGCAGLKSLIIPDSVKNIERYAFYGCTALESISVGSGVSEIGTNAFGNCSALSSLSVSASNTAFASEANVLMSADRATLITYPAGLGAASYTVPASVKKIGTFAFAYTRLASVKMTSVTEIGDYAFSSMSKLTSLDLGTSLKTVGASAFQYCTALTSAAIPEGVTALGYIKDGIESGGVFADCKALAQISLPSTVKNIYLRCFDGCTALKTVNFGGTSAEWAAVSVGGENEPLKSATVNCK